MKNYAIFLNKNERKQKKLSNQTRKKKLNPFFIEKLLRFSLSTVDTNIRRTTRPDHKCYMNNGTDLKFNTSKHTINNYDKTTV